MHFLCLHGWGTNNEVFEMQSAMLRYELGDRHTFEFVEGNVSWPMAPEIRSLFPADDDYFAYFDPGLAESCREAVDNLEKYIDLEGPFDGILAFSQGASLAATLMTKTATGELTKPLGPPFNCAIFLSAAMPMNYAALLDGQVEELSFGSLGEVITTPTAHIWGRNDREYGGMSDGLSKLCKKEFKAEFVHQGGHEVPSSGSEDSVIGAVNTIRRTIARALTVQ